MPLQKKDFIEIKFTAKTRDGEVFDSNIKEDIDKINSQIKAEPFVFCLGEGMFLKSVEDFLIGKEIGKHKIELKPEQAFGKRNPSLIQRIPKKVFIEHKLNPIPGVIFNFDGRVAKVLTSSGGRVIVDFNNPIAGKEVIYELEVVKKIEDIKEKIKSLNEFFFRKNFDSEVKDKKLLMSVEKPYVQFVELFKEKFKEILDLDLEIKEIEMPKKSNSETPKTSQ